MTTLDRYIACQYLFNVLALLVLLFCFVVAVDVALNIDIFLEAADKLNPGASGIRRVLLAVLAVAEMWTPRLLQLYTYLIGMVLVAAMGFTFTQLVRNRELVGVLAGGISLYRVSLPVLAVAALMFALKIADQEFILSRPDVAPLLTRANDDIGKRDWSEFPVKLTPDARGRVFMARRFDPAAAELTGLTVWFRDPDGRVTTVLTADSAVWRDGGWDLANPAVSGAQLTPGGLALAAPSTPSARAAPPARLVTDLDPQNLKIQRFKSFSQTLSWCQTAEMLKSPTIGDSVRDMLLRVRWSRVSQVLSGMLALIICMPFFLLREPRSMLVQSIKCAPIGIVSLVGGILLSTVPWPLLPPGFAVFIPVLILIPVAIAAVSWLRT